MRVSARKHTVGLFSLLCVAQDEAASQLRKLIHAANGKMDAIRRRLAIAATPDHALGSFRSMCTNCGQTANSGGLPHPVLVAVGCDVISAKISTHVGRLHRLAEQSGVLYARQCSRLIVKRQRQVPTILMMLNRT